MSQALEDYAVNEIQELAEHFAIPLGVDADTVQAEWQAFKPELAKLTEGSTWQATYTSLKKICKGAPEATPAMEQLMDIKAVIIWATVCCESGFSKMKLAKGELQADMKTPMLDARLRIQMLGPQDPRKLATAEKSALGRTGYNEKVKLYHTAVDDLVNKAITSWDPKKHNSALAIRQAVNGSGKLGSSHAKKADAKDPNAALINTDVIGTVEQNILPDDEVPTKPSYLVLEDSIMIAPEPNLASAELSTLNGVMLALLFENKNDYAGHLTWEWYKGKITKARRDKHNHVWVQLLFPGDDEESKVDLSDDKKLKYLTDWVLLSEQKEGGMARQKKAKTKHAAASSSSSGKKRPCPTGRAPAASKPKAKKRKQ